MRLLRQAALAILLTMFWASTTLNAASGKKDDFVKTGLNFALFPVMNYNTDLGFEAGVMGQVLLRYCYVII